MGDKNPTMIVRSTYPLEIIRIKVSSIDVEFFYARANYVSALFFRESDIPTGTLFLQFAAVDFMTEDSFFLAPGGQVVIAPCDLFEAIE